MKLPVSSLRSRAVGSAATLGAQTRSVPKAQTNDQEKDKDHGQQIKAYLAFCFYGRGHLDAGICPIFRSGGRNRQCIAIQRWSSHRPKLPNSSSRERQNGCSSWRALRVYHHSAQAAATTVAELSGYGCDISMLQE